VKTLALSFALLSTLVAAACGGGGGEDPPPPADAGPPDARILDFTECNGSDESFVRNAELALIGRRPLGEGETDVYADLLRAVKAKDGGEDVQHARRVVAQAIMQNPEYTARWERHFMEKLRVQRAEEQDMNDCYGDSLRQPDQGALARAVVAAPPGTDVPGGDFTMRDLLRSSIEADDITPVYRGHMFVIVNKPIPAANVIDPAAAEIARREDFGATFDSVYLNRDIVCLGCHNSEASTTDREDPAEDRFWPLPGLFEKSIYGASNGTASTRAHGFLRYDGGQGNEKPWGWSEACGRFSSDVDNDVANIDASFGHIQGLRTSVYDGERALRQGFEKLRTDGLVLGAGNEIADPDVAFAYLTAMNIVDGVWSEVTGNSLVIANYFPRNEASRDVLHLLTEKFIASGFSLKALLEEIVVGPYFDRLPPAAGCGTGPYNMPAVYDPWVISDSDVERRKNGPADGVHALTTRTAAHAAYAALGWTTSGIQDFPKLGACEQAKCSDLDFYCSNFQACCPQQHDYCELHLPRPDEQAAQEEEAFQLGTGMFIKNSERGFRGFEFQARLEWENRFGVCRAPGSLGGSAVPDFIDGLIQRAAAAPDSTIGDVIVALKERLIADPQLADAGERTAIEAMVGGPVTTKVAQITDLEGTVRRVCGAIMSSPQFLLAGQSAQEAAEPAAALADPAQSFDTVCARVAGFTLPDGLVVTCAAGSLSID
jgi:hypothetical protein